MSLESAAYIAEILAAAAVIPSLIYLSIQVRQSNRQTSAEARYGWVESMADINIAVAQDKQAASVWRRGLEDPKQLDADEFMQFLFLSGSTATAGW